MLFILSSRLFCFYSIFVSFYFTSKSRFLSLSLLTWFVNSLYFYTFLSFLSLKFSLSFHSLFWLPFYSRSKSPFFSFSFFTGFVKCLLFFLSFILLNLHSLSTCNFFLLPFLVLFSLLRNPIFSLFLFFHLIFSPVFFLLSPVALFIHMCVCFFFFFFTFLFLLYRLTLSNSIGSRLLLHLNLLFLSFLNNFLFFRFPFFRFLFSFIFFCFLFHVSYRYIFYILTTSASGFFCPLSP